MLFHKKEHHEFCVFLKTLSNFVVFGFQHGCFISTLFLFEFQKFDEEKKYMV